jgi:hypothetical protein
MGRRDRLSLVSLRKFMEKFETIQQVINSLSRLDCEQWISVNLKKWDEAPESCVFHYITWDYLQDLEDDEIYENDDGAELPVTLQNENLKEWMIVGSLSQIVKSMNDKDNASDFIDRVNYYREYDTFKD